MVDVTRRSVLGAFAATILPVAAQAAEEPLRPIVVARNLLQSQNIASDVARLRDEYGRYGVQEVIKALNGPSGQAAIWTNDANRLLEGAVQYEDQAQDIVDAQTALSQERINRRRMARAAESGLLDTTQRNLREEQEALRDTFRVEAIETNARQRNNSRLPDVVLDGLKAVRKGASLDDAKAVMSQRIARQAELVGAALNASLNPGVGGPRAPDAPGR